MGHHGDARGAASAACAGARRHARPLGRRAQDITAHLQSLTDADDGRSIAAWCEDRGQLIHLREQAVLRTPWQLEEADPHSYFGLHRRWRGALVGHLASFEMTSVRVMARYSAAFRRLGFDEWTRLFYDTHVVADSHHQTVAATELAAGLVEQEPALARDVAFGAAALGRLEGLLTDRVLDAWEQGGSALRQPLDELGTAPGQRARPVPARDPRTEPTEAATTGHTG